MAGTVISTTFRRTPTPHQAWCPQPDPNPNLNPDPSCAIISSARALALSWQRRSLGLREEWPVTGPWLGRNRAPCPAGQMLLFLRKQGHMLVPNTFAKKLGWPGCRQRSCSPPPRPWAGWKKTQGANFHPR